METYKKIIEIPKELVEILPQSGRPQFQKKLIELYYALVKKSKYHRGERRFFAVPANYLHKINSRYEQKIQFLIQNGFIERKDSYCYVGSNKFTKQYKLLKHNNLTEIEVELPNINENKRWFQNTKKSLLSLGYEDYRIKRDSYSNRLHHALTKDYKRVLPDYYAIDASSCHLSLLNTLMNQESIIDPEVNYALKKGLFYESLISDYEGWRTRGEVKDNIWGIINHNRPARALFKKFPIFAKWLTELKYNDKELSRRLQIIESKIFVDEILCDLGNQLDFILTIHDSIIIEGKDVHKSLSYLNENYPLFDWKVKLVKHC